MENRVTSTDLNNEKHPEDTQLTRSQNGEEPTAQHRLRQNWFLKPVKSSDYNFTLI